MEQTKSISRCVGPRAEITMQNVFDCRSAASRAASRSFGAESRLYRGISASETFDCEQ